SPTVNYGTGSGSTWANWSGVANLQHGGQYGICAQGNYSFTNDSLFIPDGPNSCSMGTMLGRRAYTTIDRSKPSAAITLGGGAQYTKSAQVALKVDFSDDVAGPFPANFLCFQYGGGPAGLCNSAAGYIYGYTPSCSVPAGAGKSTSFNCTADYGSGSSPAPDGPVWACVRAADAAIPDNPSSSNQSASADKANLSDPQCDGIVLDRTAPSASINASATWVKVGDLVSFEAQAGDATSGVSGQAGWTWGDNTAGGSGASASHTFTQAGTYEVELTVADNAGNPASASKVITVTEPSTGGQTPPPDGGTSTPGGGTGTPGGGTTEPGDDGADEADDATLTISAPRRLAATSKSIRVAMDADASGRVQLLLVRGSRMISRGGTVVLEGASAYKLKLPKGTRSGRYTIKATYTPTGGSAKRTSRAITLTGKARASKASASAVAPRSTVDGGPVAMPDGTFQGRKPARTFKVR
ncbi:MAG TPA: PKD domain-containing protein, partial [Solirubrobacteraceae bacterium]|nr:PKD domain-containing protein [Solirubrobacteraceae bacterium]